MVRLFPPAHATDEAANAQYQEMVGDDLREGRREALLVMQETMDARHLDQEQAEAWLSALNDLRLVLGTRLDVSEDMGAPPAPEDPLAPAFALYSYLTWLESQAVDALAQGLPSAPR